VEGCFPDQLWSFESLVMTFRLTNAPADFQAFINDVLRPFLDDYCTAYLDDILIFSDSLGEHKVHVRRVLEALSIAGLHMKPEKCKFHQESVKYLGLIITRDGIKMDPSKVSTVVDWPAPKHLKDVQAFLGFTHLHPPHPRPSTGASSKVLRCLPTHVPHQKEQGKHVPFGWGPAQQDAFDRLKTAFTTASVLAHFGFERQIVVERTPLILSPPVSCPSTMIKESCTLSLTLKESLTRGVQLRDL